MKLSGQIKDKRRLKNDITVFSKNAADHFQHLKVIFERCREYGISLNPKKNIFSVHESKLLGFIVSKEGITIEPERVSAILVLLLLAHKKGLQSFLGRINFIRRFIPNVAELLSPLTAMLKKGIVFSWTKEGKHSFELIKEALAAAPTLLNPDFSKDFILYAYGNIDSIAAMLVHQNDEGSEQPLAFFSQGLKDYELHYSFVEKHVLAVIRSLKKFRHMLSNNKIKIMVAHHSVKDFLLNKDLNTKRAGWITKAMEYDIEINVTKLVRGKGLCEQLAGNGNNNLNDDKDVVLTTFDEEQPTIHDIQTDWVDDMTRFLQTGRCPEGLERSKRRYYRLQAISYCLMNDILFKKDLQGVLLRCIKPDQIEHILHQFHEGLA